MKALIRWTGPTIWSISLILVFGVQEADARPSRVSQLPNGSAFNCGTCHTRANGGGPRNAFGQDIENGFLSGSGGGATVTWNATLAGLDSDGDGVTNGAELGDADGDGTPDAGATVTNPGDATSFASQRPGDNTQTPAVSAGDILALVDGQEITPDIPVTFDAGVRELQLVFGVPIDGNIGDGRINTRNLDVRVWPAGIADGIQDRRISADGLSLILNINVAVETFFRIRVSSYPGSEPGSGASYVVGTKEAPTGGVSGSVNVDASLAPIERGIVNLYFVGALEALQAGEEIGSFIAAQVPLADSQVFSFDFIEDGDYILVLRELPRLGDDDSRARRVIYDADAEGTADIVKVIGGAVTEGIDITVEPAPEPVPLQIATLTIGGVIVDEGVSNPPVASGLQDVVITLNQGALRHVNDRGELDLPFPFKLIPQLGEDAGPEFTLSGDGTSLSGTIDLPEDATFQLVFGGTRIGGENWQNFFLGTADLPESSVSGSLALPEGIEALPDRASGVVVLVPVEALAEIREELTGEGMTTTGPVDAAGKRAVLAQATGQERTGSGGLMPAEDPDLAVNRTTRQALRIEVPELDLGFVLRFVPDGTYLVGASTQTRGPDGKPRRLVGFYDPEGTGVPGEVSVSGASVADLAISLSPPALPPLGLPGDLDGNGVVDDADVNIWLGDTASAKDLNNDGSIDRADFDMAFAGGQHPPGGDGEWISGNVVSVDPAGTGFELERENGDVENVILTTDTDIALIFQGGDGDMPPPPPPGGFGKVTTRHQDPDPFFDPPQGSLTDIVVGTSVNVFGQRLATGAFEAFSIEVFVDQPDGGATVQVGSESTGPPTPDFDGDGSVGFGDFIAFAGNFGKVSTDADFDATFDLDQDGSIGFGDFITFAGLFGTTVKPALSKSVLGSGT